MSGKSSKQNAKRKQVRQQKRKEKARKKQKQKSRQNTVSAPLRINTRFRQRIAKQRPVAWDDEAPEDVAVFDSTVLETLSPELCEQVSAIREALALACVSNGSQAEDANRVVAKIPRNSPLSPWRLFVRGLQSWLESDVDAAQESWSRLDSLRRPGRIAAVLLSAQRDDFRPNADSDPQPIDAQSDAVQVYSAKLVRRIRFDRAAIQMAQTITTRREELFGESELLLGQEKLKRLKDFSSDFGDTEPRLVAALQQTALQFVINQPFVDAYEMALKFCRGPAHDPRNSLLSFHYNSKFEGGERKTADALKCYLEKDLPGNEQIPKPLCNAIISQAWFNEAEASLKSPSRFGGSPFGGMFEFGTDEAKYEDCLKQSIKAYPANAEAHKTYTDWLESKSTDDRLRAAARKPYEKKLLAAMRNWAKSIPNAAEPRLWLVDYLIENEQLEEAAPHVEWLKSSREDAPRIRSAPWKLALLEAMQLCRRKAWLQQVPEKLAEVEALWPTWLSRDWLPYLRAAVVLRCGEKDEFEKLRAEMPSYTKSSDSLKDACMMLGAAQRMRVPANDLKPLRVPIDEAVKKVKRLEFDVLTSVARFFWDLKRTDLYYPAYRMHGSKFGKELWRRLRDQPALVSRHCSASDFQSALLWMSASRICSDGYELTIPRGFAELAHKNKFVAASLINASLQLRYNWRLHEHSKQRDVLHEAVQSESDPYYRHWFGSLVKDFDEKLVESNRFSSGTASFFGAFENAFKNSFGGEGFAEGTFDEDDDEEDWLFDPECDCSDCKAARAKAKKSRDNSAAGQTELF